MKVIISHDVDHITVWEHLTRDFVLPKYFVRTLLELAQGYISGKEFKARIKEMVNNKWNYLEELMEFDKSHDIPATFFVGVSNGKGLSYSLDEASYWIKRIESSGFDVGVHGICYNNPQVIKEEFERFAGIIGHKQIGIRMHYLRLGENTLNHLAATGYLFDSSLYKMDSPFLVGNMWEFPLHIMDVYIFEGEKGHFIKLTYEEAIEKTVFILKYLQRKNIEYVTILHHDRLFSDAYNVIKNWYEWLIEYFIKNKFDILSYKEAIEELSNEP